MATLWTFVLFLYGVVFVLLVLSAFFGKKLGLRKLYIDYLLKVFEFGSKKIERKEEKRRIRVGNEDEVNTPIEDYLHKPNLCPSSPPSTKYTNLKNFQLEDILEYVTAGVAAVMEDTFMPSFEPEQLPYWNLLSRNNTRAYEFVSFRLTVCWVFGFIVRYFVLLPLRLFVLFMGMFTTFLYVIIVGILPNSSLKRTLHSVFSIFCFDLVAGSLSLVATFHNADNKPQNGIAVANHTSPIDSVVLATDNFYDMVGQRHGGLMGYFQKMLSICSSHIWFERSDSKDRASVANRMRDHTSNDDLPPLLIFPEGVCVNNTSVVQFKKGAFEVDTVIYPIAIRFDARFGDAFWWQDNFFYYILYMMTSWAIVCDVWYLPPMKRNQNENAIAFASRVKAKIAHQGGLIDLSWDGFLKATPVKSDYKRIHQIEFAKHLQSSKSSDHGPSDRGEEEEEEEGEETVELKQNNDFENSSPNNLETPLISSSETEDGEQFPLSKNSIESNYCNSRVADSELELRYRKLKPQLTDT